MEVHTKCPDLVESNKLRMHMVKPLIHRFEEAIERLQKETDLSPTNVRVASVVSSLFAQLRMKYGASETEFILSNDYIRKNLPMLREKLSDAEFAQELHDAYKLYSELGAETILISGTQLTASQLTESHLTIESKRAGAGAGAGAGIEDTSVKLECLSNWHVYKELVSQEIATLNKVMSYKVQQPMKVWQLELVNQTPPPVVFVGSGPMPLSPILLHRLGNVDVLCLEFNKVAYDASTALLERLGLRDKVTVVLMDGAKFDYRNYQHIFVASLVKNKLAVLEQINRTSVNPVVAVRTAQGLKQLMYESVDENLISKQGWEIISRTVPDEQLVINSTILLAKEQGVTF